MSCSSLAPARAMDVFDYETTAMLYDKFRNLTELLRIATGGGGVVQGVWRACWTRVILVRRLSQKPAVALYGPEHSSEHVEAVLLQYGDLLVLCSFPRCQYCGHAAQAGLASPPFVHTHATTPAADGTGKSDTMKRTVRAQ